MAATNNFILFEVTFQPTLEITTPGFHSFISYAITTLPPTFASLRRPRQMFFLQSAVSCWLLRVGQSVDIRNIGPWEQIGIPILRHKHLRLEVLLKLLLPIIVKIMLQQSSWTSFHHNSSALTWTCLPTLVIVMNQPSLLPTSSMGSLNKCAAEVYHFSSRIKLYSWLIRHRCSAMLLLQNRRCFQLRWNRFVLSSLFQHLSSLQQLHDHPCIASTLLLKENKAAGASTVSNDPYEDTTLDIEDDDILGIENNGAMGKVANEEDIDTNSGSSQYGNLPKKDLSKIAITFSGVRTRSKCSSIAAIIKQSSAVEFKYIEPGRHMPGDFPKFSLIRKKLYSFGPTSIEESQSRVSLLSDLSMFHLHLQSNCAVVLPRDQWECWIDDFKNSPHIDVGFMTLMVIIMSSSTSDLQLSQIIPRLFSMGLVSPQSIVDVASTYGMDCFCALIASSGRYYQNAERLVNAADYFIQFHEGKVRSDISFTELSSLHGVGHKTACIVLFYAFGRIEGVPSDVHVIRWCKSLGWCKSLLLNGHAISMQLQEWLPRDWWYNINPLFGSLGQLLGTARTRTEVLRYAQEYKGRNHQLVFSTIKLLSNSYSK